jgi:hypothetical protein
MGLMLICCGLAVKRIGISECEGDEGTDCGDSDIDWQGLIEFDMLHVISV